jgi:hypothetical protein
VQRVAELRIAEKLKQQELRRQFEESVSMQVDQDQEQEQVERKRKINSEDIEVG